MPGRGGGASAQLRLALGVLAWQQELMLKNSFTWRKPETGETRLSVRFTVGWFGGKLNN